MKDPVYGCAGAISVLQRQVIRLQRELDATNADLVRYACNEYPNNNNPALRNFPNSGSSSYANNMPFDHGGSYYNFPTPWSSDDAHGGNNNNQGGDEGGAM